MKSESASLTLAPDLTSFLHLLLPGERSPLYPFPTSQVEFGQGTAALKAAGFLDKQEKASPLAGRLLGNMVRAKAVTRVRLMSDGGLLEYHVFLAGDKPEEATSLRPSGKEWCFDSPASLAELSVSLEDMIGNSRIAAIPTIGELGRNSSLVLAAVIDRTRHELLEAMGKNQPWRSEPLLAESLLSLLGQQNLNPSWLLWLCQGLKTTETAWQKSDVEAALADLKTRGLLEVARNGFVLSGEALFLAGRFLLLPTLVRLDASAVTPGGVVRSAFGVVQNGVRDLLLIEPGEETWHWVGLSAQTLVGLIERYVVDPSILKGSVTASGALCSSCGKQIEPSVPFCKFCGSPQQEVKEKPRFCSKCGSELKKGKKFCPKCGAPGK